MSSSLASMPRGDFAGDRRRPQRAVRWLGLMVGVGVLWKLFAGAALAVLFGFSLEVVPGPEHMQVSSGAAAPPLSGSVAAVVDSLETVMGRIGPRRTYIVIDRANNRLWLRRDGLILREAVVSTGSGTILRESGGEQRSWTFETPAGVHKIRSMRRDPVWTKPDLAFLEEGQDPPKRLSERREVGSLGEWALDLGDGYMIHGTLYERLLGRSITHGCIRVGRDDLRAIARAVSSGTPVLIF